jgi:hypothetical protein
MAEQQTRASLWANLTDRWLWLRLVYMLILAIAWIVAEVVLLAAVVLQFLFKLFTGRSIDHLTRFSDTLADYMAQIVRFVTFVSDDRAFPFAPWPSVKRGKAAACPSPSATATDGKSEKTAKAKTTKPRSTRRSAKPKSDPANASSERADGA